MEFGLTKNKLKLLAAAAMLVDHIGAVLLPQFLVLRIIGRLAFPIFSYSIYEGCRYTHDRKTYLLQIFGLGLLCMAGYYIYEGTVFGNVLITFSLSICILYSFRLLEDKLRCGEKGSPIPFMAVLTGAALVCRVIEVDYGFVGVILPLWAEVSAFAGERAGRSDPGSQKRFSLTGFAVGLLVLSCAVGSVQIFCLSALIPLALSSGRKGRFDLKYFFYFFYPAHLMAVSAAAVLMEI